MTDVERHRPGRSPGALAEQLADRTQELAPLTASMPERPGNLVELGAEAIGAAGVLLGVDGPLRLDLGGSAPVTAPPTTRLTGLTPRTLVQATRAALATRDTVALELLAAAPVERTTREPVPAEDAAYGLAHARRLQALLRGDAAGTDLLLDALRGRGRPRRPGRVRGARPLAWTALRHDHALPTTVRSGHLPADVVTPP